MQEKKERKEAKDFASGILMMAIGAFIMFDALNMKVYNTFLDAPGFFPAIVGGVILILGAIQTYIALRLGGLKELKEVMNGGSLKALLTDEGTIRVLILIAMMVVYIWGFLGRVHFIIATSIYLTANFLYLKALKHWWISIVIAVATSVIVYYAFKFGFAITMP